MGSGVLHSYGLVRVDSKILPLIVLCHRARFSSSS